MMKIINNIISIFKKNAFFRLLFELSIATLLFNVNIYLGIALFAIVIIEIIFSKNNENLLYAFVFTFFNDEILIVPWMGGSISRIIMAVVILKLIIHIIKNRIKPNKVQIGIMLFFVISCLVGLNAIKEEAIILCNFLTFVLFSMVIKLKKNQLDKFIYKLFVTIIVGVSCGALYGILNVNFMEYNQGDKVIYRFNGSYEPNFMCLYLNVAILSLLSIRDKVKRICYYLVLSFLLLLVVLTVSFTGIAVLLASLFVYFIVFRKKWKTVIMDYLIVAIITLLLFMGLRVVKYESVILNYKVSNNMVTSKLPIKDTKKDVVVDDDVIDIQNTIYSDNTIIDRIIRSYKYLQAGKIDELTSGRTALIRDFVSASFNRPIFNILFGNNPISKKVYSSFFDHDCYSHNSYLDLLYNFGVVGFIIIISFVLYKLIKNNFLGMNIKNSLYSLNIKVVRIMILLYIFTLSMYTHRIIPLFFVL